ncbi:MAG TPA: cytochrome c peroxidase [Terriglobales bacterium]|nr:cytochrome c peroxidase [Terriglobales bacterium]
MNKSVVRRFLAGLWNTMERGGLVMEMSIKVRKLLEIGRRSTLAEALVCTICMTLIMVAVVARVGKAASPTRKVASPRQLSSFPTVDQVVSLREVPVAEPMAVVIPVDPTKAFPADSIPGPDVQLTFQSLTDCTTLAGGVEAPCLVKDQDALVRLGKTLFWDMQVGSDAVESCGTCHFNAGADIRSKNQLNPGLKDSNFHANIAPNGSKLGGDNTFGNSTVPFTANDPNAPTPSEPPSVPTCTGSDPLTPYPCNVPGHPEFTVNYQLKASDFPLNDWNNPTLLVPRNNNPITPLVTNVTLDQEMADATRDTNDIVSSQGIRHTKFLGVVPGQAVEQGTPLPDIFNTATPGKIDFTNLTTNFATLSRRTEPRNAPTMINAVFNFDNFWDGRGSFIFNGVNGSGFRDRTSTLTKTINGKPTKVFVRITNSSLASVAAEAAVSNVTMSFEGRTMADLGKKLECLRPLARQLVHPHDSVLGALSRAHMDDGELEGRGLKVSSYAEMIGAAFQPEWTGPISIGSSADEDGSISATCALPVGQYTQMQKNFSLFFSVAIQAYEATLISDDTPFDRFMGAANPARDSDGNPCPITGCPSIPADPTALTTLQSVGLSVFQDDNANLGTHCADCHVLPVSTGHTILDTQPDSQGVPSLTVGEAIEFMIMGDNLEEANYDHGMYNLGTRRTTEDKARGATAPAGVAFANPLTGSRVSISSISRTASIVIVNTASSITLAPTQVVTITGVADNTFNGTYAVATVVSPTQFTYSQVRATPLPDSSSAGGNATGPNKSFPLSLVELTALSAGAQAPLPGKIPPDVARFIPNIQMLPRRVTNGAFKAPNLRNIKFTGPYFHAGDSATLRQVVEFYTRGGNFPNTNLHDKTVDIDGIPPLDVTCQGTFACPLDTVSISAISRAANVVTVNTASPFSIGLAAPQIVTISGVTDNTFNGTFEISAVQSPTQFTFSQTAADSSSAGGTAGINVAEEYIVALVEFLANGLKDDRVAFERAPFDHPQIFVPNGSRKDHPERDRFIQIPAVGAEGRKTELPTFLNLDPQQP